MTALEDLQGGTDSILPTGGVESDNERALRLCAVLAPGTAQLITTVMLGEPASKSRPRFTRRGKPYRTREDTDAEKRTARHLGRLFEQPWTGNVAVGAVFFRPNKQRIDVDNMLKHVCDAANGVAWVDDSQVTAIYGIAELDVEKPRTILVFARHASTLTRGTDNVRACEYCGTLFELVGRTTKRFCTSTCAYKARGHDLSEPVACKQCGTPFRRKTKTQLMCSAHCRIESQRGLTRDRKPLSVGLATRSECESAMRRAGKRIRNDSTQI